MYSADVSKKVHSAYVTKAQQGQFTGCLAPFGYHKNPDNHNQLVPDEDTAWIVGLIYEHAKDGRGPNHIRRVLEEREIPCPTWWNRQKGLRNVRTKFERENPGRVHHLMSNNELAYFYVLDWSEVVTDIREQYPLLDLELAVELAAQAGIKYPTDKASGYPYVLTCDFMISTVNGLMARTIKMTAELSNARTLEKLEIERRYWKEKNIDWKIITEKEISYQKAKNIEWIFSSHTTGVASYMPCVTEAKNSLLEMLFSGEYSILEATQAVEREHSLAAGVGIQLLKELILNKKIIFNLNEPLDFSAR